jgi:hypothetical protein
MGRTILTTYYATPEYWLHNAVTKVGCSSDSDELLSMEELGSGWKFNGTVRSNANVLRI